MSIDKSVLWTVMPLMAVGTYLIRFSFLGFLGATPLPGWLRRALRYTAVAVLPGLVAPAVLWPAATGGDPDPARLIAALATVIAGVATRSMLAGIVAGGLTLFATLALLG
jgi:branched-subunit amino acid transport protein